jgi:hypothetical protein
MRRHPDRRDHLISLSDGHSNVGSVLGGHQNRETPRLITKSLGNLLLKRGHCDQPSGKVSVRFNRIEKRSQFALHSRCIQSDTPAMSGEHATEAFVNESLEGAKLGGPVVPAGVSKGMQSVPAEIPTQRVPREKGVADEEHDTSLCMSRHRNNPNARQYLTLQTAPSDIQNTGGFWRNATAGIGASSPICLLAGHVACTA